MGLNGRITVRYRNDEGIYNIYWRYNLKDGESFDKYSSQISKIKDFFTQKCGKSEEENEWMVWTSSDGQ